MFYLIALVLFLPFLMHVIVARFCGLFREGFSRQKGVLAGFLSGFFLLAVIFFCIAINAQAEIESSIICWIVYLFLIYVFSGYIYFHLFNMSETARRIRILTAVYKQGTVAKRNKSVIASDQRERGPALGGASSLRSSQRHTNGILQQSQQGLMDKNEIIRKYSCPNMVSNRLKRLVKLGQLYLSGKRYFLKGKLLLFAGKIFFRFRQILFPRFTNPTYEVGLGLTSIPPRRWDWAGYLFVCLLYIAVNLKFLFSSDLPIWDSWSFHFPAFKYIAEAVAKGCFFPQWFPASGGVRIGLFHINLFPFLPHRIIGYLLYSLLPISAVFAYKLQFIAGVLFMGLGWWMVLKKITGCPYSSFLGTLMVVMGGTGATFHQEQVLATTYLIPWFVLSLLKIKENSSYIFPAVILLGMGLSTHYPHIQLISMGLFGLLLVLVNPGPAKSVYLRQKKFFLPLGLLFIFTLLPCFYLVSNIKTVVSPLRGGQQGDIRPRNYDDYLERNCNQIASAKAEYYQQYLKPVIEWDDLNIGQAVDRCSFFVGRIGILLAFIGIFFRWKRGFPVVILLIIFSALTLGINCPIAIPKYLFLLHFPFIGIFRQWFHFFPMVNFSLSILAAFGLNFIIEYFRPKKGHLAQFLKAGGLSILIALVLFFQILDLAIYAQKYTSVFVFHKKTPPEIPDYIFSPDNFADGYFLPSSLLQYKTRDELYHLNPQAIPRQAFLVTGTPSLEERQFFLQGEYNEYKGNLENDGFSLDITVPEEGLLVTSLNYDLGFKVFVNRGETGVKRVNNALAGVLLEKGNQRIKFKLITGAYPLIAVSQVFIYIFLILFFVFVG